MSFVIVHKYVEPNLEKLKINENADCSKCMMSEKTRIIDNEDGYLCKAALYDIKTLSCFVPKQETEAQPLTKADQLRNMSNEELAKELTMIAGWDRKEYSKAVKIGLKKVMLDWLRQPVEDTEDGN